MSPSIFLSFEGNRNRMVLLCLNCIGSRMINNCTILLDFLTEGLYLGLG